MDKCPYCQHYHGGNCPAVKAIEYHPNGQIKRVEFWGNSHLDVRGPDFNDLGKISFEHFKK